MYLDKRDYVRQEMKDDIADEIFCRMDEWDMASEIAKLTTAPDEDKIAFIDKLIEKQVDHIVNRTDWSEIDVEFAGEDETDEEIMTRKGLIGG